MFGSKPATQGISSTLEPEQGSNPGKDDTKVKSRKKRDNFLMEYCKMLADKYPKKQAHEIFKIALKCEQRIYKKSNSDALGFSYSKETKLALEQFQVKENRFAVAVESEKPWPLNCASVPTNKSNLATFASKLMKNSRGNSNSHSRSINRGLRCQLTGNSNNEEATSGRKRVIAPCPEAHSISFNFTAGHEKNSSKSILPFKRKSKIMLERDEKQNTHGEISHLSNVSTDFKKLKTFSPLALSHSRCDAEYQQEFLELGLNSNLLERNASAQLQSPVGIPFQLSDDLKLGLSPWNGSNNLGYRAGPLNPSIMNSLYFHPASPVGLPNRFLKTTTPFVNRCQTDTTVASQGCTSNQSKILFSSPFPGGLSLPTTGGRDLKLTSPILNCLDVSAGTKTNSKTAQKNGVHTESTLADQEKALSQQKMPLSPFSFKAFEVNPTKQLNKHQNRRGKKSDAVAAVKQTTEKNCGVQSQVFAGEREIRETRPCRCKKSKCLKMYCDCFATGELCSTNCECTDCRNSMDFIEERDLAISKQLLANPSVFQKKRVRSNGCNCRKSGCLKKYCECYAANSKCQDNCKCVSCKNTSNSCENKSSISKAKLASSNKYTFGKVSKSPRKLHKLSVAIPKERLPNRKLKKEKNLHRDPFSKEILKGNFFSFSMPFSARSLSIGSNFELPSSYYSTLPKCE